MDFEAAAKRALPPAHWGYMSSGVDDDLTLKANHEAFQHYKLRARRLVDGSKPDLRTEVFGQTWESPIFICPCGSQRAFHNDGERGTARAAKAKQTQMILSTQTNTPIEDVNKAYGKPVWFQLYTTSRWDATEKLVKRAEDSGSPVLVFTIDQQAGRNTETQARIRPQDTRNCTSCHEGGGPATFSQQGKPMYAGIDTNGLALVDPALTWTSVERLKKFTGALQFEADTGQTRNVAPPLTRVAPIGVFVLIFFCDAVTAGRSLSRPAPLRPLPHGRLAGGRCAARSGRSPAAVAPRTPDGGASCRHAASPRRRP